MGKKTRTQSALKSSNILYLENNNSKFGAEKLYNNLRESKSENSIEVDQCIFLGALCLKPVPDVFHVSLQPISPRQQSNSNILHNNNTKNNQIKRERSNSSRKNKNKKNLSSSINKNFFIGNVSDHKFENKILKLIGQVKQSIKEEIGDKSKLNINLDNQSEVKSRNFFEYSIEAGGILTKKKLKSPRDLSSNAKIEVKKFPEDKKLLKKDSDTKTSSVSQIKMTSERMKTYENFNNKGLYVQEGNNKLNTNVQISSLDKDIAVENVIRRLRQKKSIEVKKVQDVDSKLKRISQMPETKPKPEQFDQSNPFIINLDSYDTPKSSETVEEPKIHVGGGETTDYLELEDDDIEDYLEIDQNVVEDLEALIPEEEIVSISNSLIQPDNNDLSIESVQDLTINSETKPENTDISIPALPEPIVISDSNNSEPPKIEPPLVTEEIKDEEVENNIQEQPKDVAVLNAPKPQEENSPNNEEIITINNNGPLSKNFEAENPINIKPVETLKRKSGEIIPGPKKMKISPKTNKSQPKKKESRRSNKSRQDSSASKNLRKITDFFVPNCVKTENIEEQNLQIKEKESEKILQTVNDKNTENDSPQGIELKTQELPHQTRTLRSRSVLPLKVISEPKIKVLQSTHVNQVNKKVNNEQTIELRSETTNKTETEEIQSIQEIKTNENNINNAVNKMENNNTSPEISSKELSVVEKTVSPIEIIDNSDEIQPKTETSIVNSENTNTSITEAPKKVVKENNKKRQQKGGNKRSSTRKSKVSKQPENINNAQENEEKALEIVTPVEKVIAKETPKKKEVSHSETENTSKTTDIMKNNVLPGSSTEKEEITDLKSQSTPENVQIIGIEIKDSPEIPMESTNITTEKEKDKIECSTQTKQTQKKKGSVKRKKTVAKIPDQPIIEKNETKNNKEKVDENNQSQSEEVKGNQSKKGKSKTQKRSRPNDLVQDKNETKIEQKNQATKLEIYDFDDKSNEAVEVLEKSVKRRKQTTNKNASDKQSNVDLTNDQNSPSSCKKPNENNNTPNLTSRSIESYFRSSIDKPSNNLTTDKDVAVPKDETSSVDSNNTTSSETAPKTSPEAEKEVDQFGQDWKPSYGPYKRIDRCNVCLLSFKSYKKLRAHKKIHEVENLYKCWECNDCFEDVEKLAAHLRIHKGKMPYPCKKCDATFWTTFQLERHQLVHVLKKVPPPAKPPSKVFKCEECGKQFKKICDLERHTRVHTGEKPSVCNICNKRFQQSYNLNKHLYTHTQEKNFECVICQKKFGRNDVLNRHVLTHSIVKPFRCSICSRTFIRNSQLKLHLRKHHGLDEDPGNETSVDDPSASTSAKE